MINPAVPARTMTSVNSYTTQWDTIDWDVIDPERIDAKDHGSIAGLQLADVVTSAIHHAVEPDGFGNFEQSYAQALRGRLLRGPNGLIINFGITPIPPLHKKPPLTPEQLAFFQSFAKK